MLDENIELPDDDKIEISDDIVNVDEPTEPEIVQQKSNDDGGKKSDQDEYGRKVSKRISKLVAERNSARDELGVLRKENDEMRMRIDEASQESIDAQLDVLRKEKAELLEAGEYADATVIDDKMMEAKIRRANIDNRDAPKPQEEQGGIPQAQQEWLNSKAHFFDANPDGFKKADSIYLDMVTKEGFDPHDHDTYAEIDKRLSQEEKPIKQPPPPTAAPDRGSASGNSEGEGEMSKYVISKMISFGLDPNNPSHRKAWLANHRRK